MLVEPPGAGFSIRPPGFFAGSKKGRATLHCRDVLALRAFACAHLAYHDFADRRSVIMHLLSTRFRYGAVAQALHWVTALLVMAAYFMGPGGSEQRVYSSALDFTRQTHETLGLAVFVIVLVRLLWRFVDTAPEDPPTNPWMRYSAKLVHLLLYGLLIATPGSAIVGAWLEGHPVMLWGFGNIGPMLSPVHELGLSLAALHTTLGDIILWVAGLHAVAALFHHFFLHDGVFLAMVPGRWR
jgi:cytochrome b561